MQGVPQPRMVAQDLDQRCAGVVGDKNTICIFIVLEHTERVAVGDLTDRIKSPVVDLLAKVHRNEVAGR